MKTIAAALLLLSLATTAYAAPTRGTVADTPGRYTCSRGPLERVAFAPAPCCSGLFACPQLLANTGLVKPKRSDRT